VALRRAIERTFLILPNSLRTAICAAPATSFAAPLTGIAAFKPGGPAHSVGLTRQTVRSSKGTLVL